MQYIASFSGGMGSAIMIERLITRYGRKNVMIWMSNTNFESEGNQRFVADCMARWGGRLYGTNNGGKNPYDIFEEKRIIPNSMIAPCTRALKIEPFQAWLWRLPKPVTVCLGYGWNEPQRVNKATHYHKHQGKPRAPQGYARRIHGVYVDYPLLWKPYDFRSDVEIIRSWGIEPSEHYEFGFSHDNCGGECVKQGIAEWRRFKYVYPDRFARRAAWERMMQAKLGTDRTILKQTINGVAYPLPLDQIDADTSQMAMTLDSRENCVCGFE